MRDSFMFYRSFFESFTELSQKDRLKLFDALCNYALNDVEPELSGIPAAIFVLLKPQVDANNRKYENAKKGGRPSGNQNETKDKPKENQNETKPKPNDNVNVNDNENENGLGFKKPTDLSSLFKRVVDYLNGRVGTNYKVSKSTEAKLTALVEAGFSEDDMKAVIDKKYFDWRDDEEMRGYLRPYTLFGDKFEEYLNAPISLKAEQARDKKKRVEDLRKEREEKQEALRAIYGDIEAIRSGSGIAANRDEYRALKEQAAILEDTITRINKRLEAN